ncbi:MAG: TauD/TfdA family dioxygenase, partial [Mesorhizobium sp.]|uniref:TauD/TfdA dioxygenase family protein n=1 Tax=Mesorhizobium sp. TaxID=1871066 RepID=UPI000FE5B227
MTTSTQPRPSLSALTIKPVAARIGAEIADIKLSGDLSDEEIAAINAALLQHKVIFFRDQDQLTDTEQERFSKRL